MRGRAHGYPQPPAEARLAGTRPVVATSSCHTNTALSVAAPVAAPERRAFAEVAGEVGRHPSGAEAPVPAPGHGRPVPGASPPGGHARSRDPTSTRPRRPRRARPARRPHNAPGTSRSSLHHRFCRGDGRESGRSARFRAVELCHTCRASRACFPAGGNDRRGRADRLESLTADEATTQP